MTELSIQSLFDEFVLTLGDKRDTKITSEFSRLCGLRDVPYSKEAKLLVREYNAALKDKQAQVRSAVPFEGTPYAKNAKPVVIERDEPDEPVSKPDEPVSKPDEPVSKPDEPPVPPSPLSNPPVAVPLQGSAEYSTSGKPAVVPGTSLHDLVVKSDTVSTGKMIKVKSLRGVVDIRDTIIPADEVVEVRYTAEVTRAVEVGILEIV